MIKFKYKRHPLDACSELSVFDKPQEGDILIEIPYLTYNEEKYATIIHWAHPELDESVFCIGQVSNIKIKCICTPGKLVPKGGLLYPNCDYIPEKIKEYIVSMTLIDNDTNCQNLEIKVDNPAFLLKIIQQYIDPLLKEGHSVKSFNYDWIRWQCTSWNCSEANSQGRNFTFKDSDIYSIECLYDYICGFDIKVISNAISKRGGGSYWKDVYITVDNKDPYINEIIGEALSTKATLIDDKVTYKVEIENESRDGYCPEGERTLSDDETKKYRRMFQKKLLISVLRSFDLETMKKRHFLNL